MSYMLTKTSHRAALNHMLVCCAEDGRDYSNTGCEVRQYLDLILDEGNNFL